MIVAMMAPMTLLQLPSEILLHILDHVGASFFHQDTNRLRVSKRWYSLAWLILARDPHLSLQTLARLLANEEAFGRIQPHVGSVNLVLHFVDKTAPDRPNVNDKRVVEANSHLDQLAVLLRQCPQLKALSIVAQVNFFGLSTGSIGSLLSACPLTSLHINIPTRLALWRGRPGYNDHIAHLCCCINALLPSLRRLRCRMHLICDRLLEPLPDDTNGPLKLEELIINFTHSPFIGRGRWNPRSCDSILAPFTHTQHVVEAQAAALAARLPNPRMVRVIGHGSRELRGIYAYNAITKRREIFNFHTEWDAPGTVVADKSGGSIWG
ncbi:hypothetical protein F5144DRAFT_569932 [Chaetomium tenue]|uniref:Uncharacterized protein n=1 Tax=Chaetomium tenue TaxID=1854479 RepID=A0ACB7PDR0_9PEZI|nr:hypothetical protein F5144DRAFT_569932 [Chaetomium globosum]